ncbi:hypothetical protein SDC9_114426 [bioreactor metagenome]|uniref:Uncharacterized protein n=1 Tax=bioreactor metagenome TaxID=1076179 RepID=A0A645BWJ7_9ZZZZ
MKIRWWLAAVEAMASTASMIRCSAVSVPIVMSVPTMSLSIEPTSPAIIRSGWVSATWRSSRPSATSSSSSSCHSWRRVSAPVRDPSPPTTASRSIPLRTRLRAAARRPSRSRNSWQRAVPITVPPRCMMPETSSHSSATMSSPPLTAPCHPSRTAKTSAPAASAERTTARIAGFMPGASPPLVRTPMRTGPGVSSTVGILRQATYERDPVYGPPGGQAPVGATVTECCPLCPVIPSRWPLSSSVAGCSSGPSPCGSSRSRRTRAATTPPRTPTADRRGATR